MLVLEDDSFSKNRSNIIVLVILSVIDRYTSPSNTREQTIEKIRFLRHWCQLNARDCVMLEIKENLPPLFSYLFLINEVVIVRSSCSFSWPMPIHVLNAMFPIGWIRTANHGFLLGRSTNKRLAETRMFHSIFRSKKTLKWILSKKTLDHNEDWNTMQCHHLRLPRRMRFYSPLFEYDRVDDERLNVIFLILCK